MGKVDRAAHGGHVAPEGRAVAESHGPINDGDATTPRVGLVVLETAVGNVGDAPRDEQRAAQRRTIPLEGAAGQSNGAVGDGDSTSSEVRESGSMNPDRASVDRDSARDRPALGRTPSSDVRGSAPAQERDVCEIHFGVSGDENRPKYGEVPQVQLSREARTNNRRRLAEAGFGSTR